MTIVEQKSYHCGVACAETVLRAYGVKEDWANQRRMALFLCGRLAEFKDRHPKSYDAKERYYPEYVETYQPLLAELLIDRGYNVISTRASIDPKTKKPLQSISQLLKSHLAEGHLAIVHVPGHYTVAVGIDSDKNTLQFGDTWRSEKIFSCDFEDFSSGLSFHTKRNGTARPGWDGRVVIIWSGEDHINEKDTCPVCGKVSAEEKYTYCPTCRCFIDRRQTRTITKAIDTITNCCHNYHITRVDANCLKEELKSLVEAEGISQEDLKLAMCNYPLKVRDKKSIMTLSRYSADYKSACEYLSVADLVAVISAGNQWRRELESRVRPGGFEWRGEKD